MLLALILYLILALLASPPPKPLLCLLSLPAYHVRHSHYPGDSPVCILPITEAKKWHQQRFAWWWWWWWRGLRSEDVERRSLIYWSWTTQVPPLPTPLPMDLVAR